MSILGSQERENITADLRRVAAMLGKPSLTRADILKHGKVTVDSVLENFGSLKGGLAAAGLAAERIRTNAELLEIVADIWTRTRRDYGRRPHLSDFEKYGIPVDWWKVTRRFGSWNKTLEAASRVLVPEKEAAEIRPERKPSRKQVSKQTRFFIFQRDLYTCRICRGTGVALELDHVVPVSRGGTNHIDNLQTLCVDCNRGKGNCLQ